MLSVIMRYAFIIQKLKLSVSIIMYAGEGTFVEMVSWNKAVLIIISVGLCGGLYDNSIVDTGQTKGLFNTRCRLF